MSTTSMFPARDFSATLRDDHPALEDGALNYDATVRNVRNTVTGKGDFVTLGVTNGAGDTVKLLDVNRAELAGIRDAITDFLGDDPARAAIDWIQTEGLCLNEIAGSGMTSIEEALDALIDLCDGARVAMALMRAGA
mgnify:CR=1 FL=1